MVEMSLAGKSADLIEPTISTCGSDVVTGKNCNLLGAETLAQNEAGENHGARWTEPSKRALLRPEQASSSLVRHKSAGPLLASIKPLLIAPEHLQLVPLGFPPQEPVI